MRLLLKRSACTTICIISQSASTKEAEAPENTSTHQWLLRIDELVACLLYIAFQQVLLCQLLESSI